MFGRCKLVGRRIGAAVSARRNVGRSPHDTREDDDRECPARSIGSSVGCEGCGRNTRHAAAHSRVEAEETRHRPTSFPIVLRRVARLVIRSASSETYTDPQAQSVKSRRFRKDDRT